MVEKLEGNSEEDEVVEYLKPASESDLSNTSVLG